MSNKAFQQNLDDKKGPQPGGPYLIQMLFKEPVEMPDKEKMTAIMEKHIGSTECFCYDKKMAGFALPEDPLPVLLAVPHLAHQKGIEAYALELVAFHHHQLHRAFSVLELCNMLLCGKAGHFLIITEALC